jgi:AraC-like DNA-binding protein
LFGPGVTLLTNAKPTRARSVSTATTLGGRPPGVLYDPAVDLEPDAASSGEAEVRAWKPAVPGVREVFHARFADHAYPPHVHTAWTLFIVDEGSIRYDLHRHRRGADRSTVTVLPPHVVHDGRPGHGDGYRKRVLYLEADMLGEDLIGAAVDRSVVPGSDLREAISAAHDALACVDDLLEAETRLAFVTERIRNVLGRNMPAVNGSPDTAEHLRAYLDEHLTEPITLRAAAAAIGAGPTHLARAFTSVYGIAPHAYVMGRRLDLARDQILGGRPLAEVAAAVGFFDQAHLTHRFRRFLGTTPGRFAGH